MRAIMPNYITAAIAKAKNMAANIRGYCQPVAQGTITLPTQGIMVSVTVDQLGDAVEKAATKVQAMTTQCRDHVEELERAAGMRANMRQAHQTLAAAIANRGLPADPARWSRDLIVKFRDGMTPEERALNLRIAMLDADRPILASIAGLGTREVATIADDAMSQVALAPSPPSTQLEDIQRKLDQVREDKMNIEQQLHIVKQALEDEETARKKDKDDAEKAAGTVHSRTAELALKFHSSEKRVKTAESLSQDLAAPIQEMHLEQERLTDEVSTLEDRWQARQRINEEQLLQDAESHKAKIELVEEERDQFRQKVDALSDQIAKDQETLAEADAVKHQAMELAREVAELRIETMRLKEELQQSEKQLRLANDDLVGVQDQRDELCMTLGQANAQLKAATDAHKKTEKELAGSKKRSDALHEELYKRLTKDVNATRSAADSPDVDLRSSRIISSRITGLPLDRLPGNTWKAFTEALGGPPIPILPAGPELWSFHSSIPPLGPAMPTITATCLALFVASASPSEPQEPLLANLCTFLSSGTKVASSLVELVLRGINYRSTEEGSRSELVWLVAVAAHLAGVDIWDMIAPTVAGLKQPFKRMVGADAGNAVASEAKLRRICTTTGVLCRGNDVGFMEGVPACMLVEFKDRRMEVIRSRMFFRESMLDGGDSTRPR